MFPLACAHEHVMNESVVHLRVDDENQRTVRNLYDEQQGISLQDDVIRFFIETHFHFY